MIEENIQRAESAVKSAENISSDKREELLGLLEQLKSALGKVSLTHHEDAESIARLAEASAHEVTRRKKRPKLLKTVLDGLRESVEEFESSHPEAVRRVNEFATLLADMGL